jgi:acyl-coenzyme A thioesterase PaaI-like protein
MKPAFLQTTRKESGRTWRFRTFMNWYPMFFGTGGKILFWSGDWREVHLRLRRNIWTYNYVGTIFGGSLFSAADPFYMLMLYHVLGRDFVVWDKAASIRFRRPGRSTLYARYELTNELTDGIRADVAINGQTERVLAIDWVDAEGVVHAQIERTVYVADKAFYEHKKQDRQSSRFDRKA